MNTNKNQPDTQTKKSITYTVTFYFNRKERRISFGTLKDARDFITRFRGDKKSTISQVYRITEELE